MGGHCRTGLEDNVRWDRDRLAASNAELVGRVAHLCAEHGRAVATPGPGAGDSRAEWVVGGGLSRSAAPTPYLRRYSV